MICYTHPQSLLRIALDPGKILSEKFPKEPLCQPIEFHTPGSISNFFLSGSSMLLLQHKRILNSEQKHNLKHKTHTIHKNACTNGLYKALFRRSL